MIKKILLICSIICAGTILRANDTKQEFERLLREKSVQIISIKCDFKQIRTMAVFAEDDIKEGMFTYKRPGNILLHFEDGDYIKMTETDFSIRNVGVTTDVKVSANPMLKELKRLLSACMTGDITAMSSGFNMGISENPDSYIVILTPIKGRGASRMKSVTMYFDKKDMSLSKLILEEPSGDSIGYEFWNKKFNIEVSEETFGK